MIPELGHYALVLALALGLIQSVAPICGARGDDGALMRVANSTALNAICICRTVVSGSYNLLRYI